jgi:hypothetical protein
LKSQTAANESPFLAPISEREDNAFQPEFIAAAVARTEDIIARTRSREFIPCIRLDA